MIGMIKQPHTPIQAPSKTQLLADYDVFVVASFKRSAAARGELAPKFRLLVAGYAEPPPALGALRALAAQVIIIIIIITCALAIYYIIVTCIY
jgi:hypothetical protein